MDWRTALSVFSPRRGANAECTFCTEPRVRLVPRGAQLACPSCGMVFALSRGAPVVVSSGAEPLASNADAGQTVRTCIPLRNNGHSEPVLCRTCLNHESIVLQLMGAYMDNEPSDDEDDDGDTRGAAAYRTEVEQRYPLCGPCRARVAERLRAVETRLRGRALAPGPSRRALQSLRVAPAHARTEDAHASRPAALLDAALQGVLVVPVLARVASAIFTRSNWKEAAPIPFAALAPPLFWDGLCGLLFAQTLYSALLMRSPRLALWAFLLLYIRRALVSLLISPSNSALFDVLPPEVPLCVASTWLLAQVRGPLRRRRVAVLSKPSQSVSVPPSPLPTAPIAVSTPAKDGTATLEQTLNSALQSLGPDTPVSTRYADLIGRPAREALRKTPFAVPESLAKPSAPVARAPVPEARPSRLSALISGADDGGLASILGTSSLCDSPDRASPARPPIYSRRAHTKEALLSLGLVLVRLALHWDAAGAGAVAVVILLALALPGPFVRHAGARASLQALALARLVHVVLVAHGTLSSAHALPALAVDVVLVALR